MTTFLDSQAVTRFHNDLGLIPQRYSELPNVITGIKGLGAGSPNPAESKAPLSVGVIHLLDTAIPRVGMNLRMIVEEMNDDGQQAPSIDRWMSLTELCETIRQTSWWLKDQPWATEVTKDLHALRVEMEQALGITQEYLPRCRTCDARVEPQDNGSWYLCVDCGRQYVIAEDLKALGAAQYLRAEEVAQLLDIPWSTLRYWKRVGWVRPIETTAAGIALYDLDQVRVVRDTPPVDRVCR
ncbi:MAG: MerR family transcriptional regulator [Actinobacteria bacterium]|nr:MerR family transcriptional regulator [Actinomycetota bacterium]